MRLKSIPKVRICVGFVNKGVVCHIFGKEHQAPIIRENYIPSKTGEMPLREAIREFNLNLEEIKFLR